MGRDLFLIRFILLSTLQKHAFRENKSLKIFFKKKILFQIVDADHAQAAQAEMSDVNCLPNVGTQRRISVKN